MLSEFAADLQNRIEAAYAESGNNLGWRLLMSPEKVLNGARVAFIGLNPGGSMRPEEHSEFAMPSGSAYVVESWAEAAPGTSKLQRQVRLLFACLKIEPDDVLAGNLVPFRSPSFDRLSKPKESLKFGEQLWSEILERVRPELVVAMGGQTIAALRRLLSLRMVERIPLSWGTVTGTRSVFDDRLFVGLPHLSRFSVVSRAKSQNGLAALFEPYWKP